VEPNDILEELKLGVADRCPWEERNGSIAWPGNDRHKSDTDDHCAADLVYMSCEISKCFMQRLCGGWRTGHEQGCEYATNKKPKPHGGTGRFVADAGAGIWVEVLRRTATEFERSGFGSCDCAQASVRQADQSEKKTDTRTAGHFDRGWDDTGEPSADAEDGKSNEDETFHKDSGHGDAVVDGTCSMEADHLVGEIGVQTHGWRNGNGEICTDAHEKRAKSCDGGCGGDEVAVDFEKAERVGFVG
jgi:hypothetical protein